MLPNRCPRLLSLTAPQCGALHSFYDDAWHCPQLRSLNLFGCRRVSGAQLESVLGHMMELRTLNLNGCWELPRLHLASERGCCEGTMCMVDAVREACLALAWGGMAALIESFTSFSCEGPGWTLWFTCSVQLLHLIETRQQPLPECQND